MILADNLDRHKMSNEFENWSNLTKSVRAKCHWLLKKKKGHIRSFDQHSKAVTAKFVGNLFIKLHRSVTLSGWYDITWTTNLSDLPLATSLCPGHNSSKWTIWNFFTKRHSNNYLKKLMWHEQEKQITTIVLEFSAIGKRSVSGQYLRYSWNFTGGFISSRQYVPNKKDKSDCLRFWDICLW